MVEFFKGFNTGSFKVEKHICPLCNKEFEDVETAYFPGKLCHDCRRAQVEITRLLFDEAIIDKDDAKITKEIISLLNNKDIRSLKHNKQIIKQLIQKVYYNEDRKKAILMRVIKLLK